MKRLAYTLACMIAGAALHARAMQKPAPGGYIVEHDPEVAVTEPGTHNGGGQTVRASANHHRLARSLSAAHGRSPRVR